MRKLWTYIDALDVLQETLLSERKKFIEKCQIKKILILIFIVYISFLLDLYKLSFILRSIERNNVMFYNEMII